MGTIFIGDLSYYTTFIDNSTRKVRVYFLKLKYDIFDIFKKLKVWVENETCLKIKCLHYDNGGEYELDEFNEYCAVNEISMEKPLGEPVIAMEWLNV